MQRGGKRRRSGNRRKPSSNFISSGKPWQDHIKETMRKNPDMKFGRALLKLASRTYNKGPSSARSSSARSSARSSTARSSASPPGAVNLRTSNYSVRVRPKKSRTKRKTKRPKRPKRTKKSAGFLGF